MTKPRRVELVADADVGDIVRLDVGLVRVGPLLSRDAFCRLVELDEATGDYRDAGGPLHIATRTRVLALVRDRSYYLAHRRAGGGAVDPLQERP